jgi:glutathione synthase/RimK-type ligase-like ATP-grasp enzyme
MITSVKLAIHAQTDTYSDRWIKYCTEHGIEFKIVNCYDVNIIKRLRNVDGLLWHWRFYEPQAQLTARQIIASIESMGIKIFPNTATCWHYDDKIGQQYLLEAIGAPTVTSYGFYEKQAAMEWIDKTDFPKVFKLRSGAGSTNVRLVRTKREAQKYCKRAFGKGFATTAGYFSDAKTKVRKIKDINLFINKFKRLPNIICDISRRNHQLDKQKGYIYFQQFLPDNEYDTRITIIGNRAFGFKRKNRPGDFRASGSGEIIYDTDGIDKRCIQIAFNVAQRLKTQSLAFDFIFDEDHEPKILEISYCFQNRAVFDCTGYWDNQINWFDGHVWPEDAILIDLINEISS